MYHRVCRVTENMVRLLGINTEVRKAKQIKIEHVCKIFAIRKGDLKSLKRIIWLQKKMYALE